MRRRLGVLILSSAVLAGTAACTSGPKLAEVGPRFQQNAQALIDKLADRRGVEGSKPTVKQDAGTDVPCGDGKAKRVFDASVPLQLGSSLDNTFDQTIDTVGAELVSIGYSIKTRPDSDDLSRREMAIGSDSDDNPATMHVILTATPSPLVTLTGETSCLDAG
jgi:hypothetical protein